MAQNSSPATFMPTIAASLATSLSMHAGRIKIVDMDTFTGKLTESAQEKTVLLTLGDMTQLNSGGGRNALVTRPLLVQLVTESYKDPGGRSELAMASHWAFEELVAGALLLLRPSTITSGHPITFGKLSPVNFDLPIDPARYRSSFALDVTYQLNIAC